MTQSLRSAIEDIFEIFEYESAPFKPTRWQGKDVSKKPEATMREMLHVNFEAKLKGENLDFYSKAINPNQPWADKHFEERVCGYPINPGVEWANWPWGVAAETSLDEKGMFNHNYMERYWPKLAGQVDGPTADAYQWGQAAGDQWIDEQFKGPNTGIRHRYGDLGDLVAHLAHEPDSRQAYLPVWFPEDTGTAHDGRKPCTLGYHFIMRNNKLDVVYYLRSCDLYHHFRDDIYLTVRLLLWVLQECRKLSHTNWERVEPGKIVVQISNLHMFINDYRKAYA